MVVMRRINGTLMYWTAMQATNGCGGLLEWTEDKTQATQMTHNEARAISEIYHGSWTEDIYLSKCCNAVLYRHRLVRFAHVCRCSKCNSEQRMPEYVWFSFCVECDVLLDDPEASHCGHCPQDPPQPKEG